MSQATSALLIRGGHVHTADAANRIHVDGSVLAVDGRIVAVGEAASVERAVRELPPGAAARLHTVDARESMVLPGFVNAHWHEMFGARVAFKGALRDIHDADDTPGYMAHGGDLPQVSVAFDRFHTLVDALTPAEAEAFATYSLWTQLRCGTTTIGDLGSLNRPEALTAALRRLGMRGAVSMWASDAVCAPGKSRYRRTRDTEALLGQVEDLLGSVATAPSGLVKARPSILCATNMTDELGSGLAQLAERHDTSVGAHVGSLRNEGEVVEAYFGKRSIRRFAELGLLSDRLLAAHCAWADEEEYRLLVDAGVHFSHSPAKYGANGESTLSETGMFTRLIRAGANVSLSTDGMVLPLGGMTETMRAAWQAHNEMSADQTVVRPTTALEMATRVPARSLRWADDVGSLELGKQADLVIVPAHDWRYLLNPRPLEAFLTLGSSTDVDTVIVGGRVLIDGGRPAHFDEAELRDDYLSALASFSRRVPGVPEPELNRLLGPAKDGATP